MILSWMNTWRLFLPALKFQGVPSQEELRKNLLKLSGLFLVVHLLPPNLRLRPDMTRCSCGVRLDRRQGVKVFWSFAAFSVIVNDCRSKRSSRMKPKC
eukprot:m.236614 g.236614  ORF g.236614 m.236614 type:complete len:98 (+) comp40136_c0_seq7:3021-3314(+)